MTFDEALAMVNRPADPDMPADKLSELMIELLSGSDALGEMMAHPHPIGMGLPEVVSLGNGTCGVLVDPRGDALTPDEARGYAATIMRMADEADVQNGDK
jgi:hypothetical protein